MQRISHPTQEPVCEICHTGNLRSVRKAPVGKRLSAGERAGAGPRAALVAGCGAVPAPAARRGLVGPGKAQVGRPVVEASPVVRGRTGGGGRAGRGPLTSRLRPGFAIMALMQRLLCRTKRLRGLRFPSWSRG